MSQIALTAGITAPVIYDHFPSKAALQIELLERQTTELIAFVASALARSPEDTGERLRAGVDAYFRFVEEHSFAWRMLFRDPPHRSRRGRYLPASQPACDRSDHGLYRDQRRKRPGRPPRPQTGRGDVRRAGAESQR